MTDSFTVYPTDISVECKLNYFKSVSNCVHANNLSYINTRGMMNTFRVQSVLILGCTCTFTPVSAGQHIQSSQTLFLGYNHYSSAGKHFLVELSEIRDKTRCVMSRVVVRQNQYGKDKVTILPGM
jgi:hypothetical protein